MDLKEIGFYTLDNERARTASSTSQMKSGEIILMDRCNFRCGYCRGLKKEYRGMMPLEKAKKIIDVWCDPMPIENIRFSGGEPTLHYGIFEMVRHARSKGIRRIAISTNGSALPSVYANLIQCGVNDFSIPLDACCSADGDKMAGGVVGSWERVGDNIRMLSQKTYVSVGVVLNENNVQRLKEIVIFADSLGVADIRIITSAQFNKDEVLDYNIPEEVLRRHPILAYRVKNIREGKNIRGLKPEDFRRCPLVLDDNAIVGNDHYPCIIHLREQGNPVGNIFGKTAGQIREERRRWFENTNVYENPICRKNCLDVCVAYNNKWLDYQVDRVGLPKTDPSNFDWQRWKFKETFLDMFGIRCRFEDLTAPSGKEIIRSHAIGWCDGASLSIKPRNDSVGLMFQFNGELFWCHIRKNEFYEIFREESK